MAKVSLSLSSKTDARGLSEVLIRFVGGKDKIFRLKSGIFVPPARWDHKAGRLVIPRLATDEQRWLLSLQGRLEDLRDNLITTYVSADPVTVTASTMREAVRRFHHPDVIEERSVDACFRSFMEQSRVGSARMRRYKVMQRDLRRFQVYGGLLLYVDEMTAAQVREFEEFLLTEHTLTGKKAWMKAYAAAEGSEWPEPRSRNTTSHLLSVLRTFFNWCRRQGITQNNPFDRFQIGACVYGTPYYLTIEERDRIARCNLYRHPRLASVRDVFVFQCLVGCRVGDLLKLRKEDVADGVLEYVPRKTKEGRPHVVRVPLVPQAREIVDRYSFLPGEALLPCISAQKYNVALKRIFLAARIRRMVSVINPVTREEEKRPLNEVASSHLARRTFVGNLYKQVKDPNIVGSMSGHAEGSTAFARYRTIDDEMKREVVDLLQKK